MNTKFDFQAITDCILEDDGGVDDIEEASGTMTGGVQNNNSELARFVKLIELQYEIYRIELKGGMISVG